MLRHNEWTAGLARARGLAYVDIYSRLVNPASATNQWISAYTYDGTHPSNHGASIIATAVAEALSVIVPPVEPRLLVSLGDPSVISPMGDGLFLGAVTNGVAAGWLSADVEAVGITSSVVIGSVGDVGNWQRLTFSNASGTRYISKAAYIAAGYSIGDNLVLSAKVRTSPDYNGLMSMLVYQVGAAAPQGAYAMNSRRTTTTAPPVPRQLFMA